MRVLMTATSLAALIAASSAFAQSQDSMPQNPMPDNPPAAMEPATPLPESGASGAMKAPDASPSMSETDKSMTPNPNATAPEATAQATASGDRFIAQQDASEILASSLIGSTVQNPAGDDLGDINDVVLSDNGTVDAIVIGVGGFLGIGEKNVGVGFDAIEKSTDENGNVILVLNATADELESAPQYVTVEAAKQQQEMQTPTGAPSPASPPPAQ